MTGICLNDITIRHTLRSGDLGEIVSMHGIAYHADYGYDLHFESYVARGIHAFYEKYDPSTDRIRLCEHEDNLAGSCALQLKEAAIHLYKKAGCTLSEEIPNEDFGKKIKLQHYVWKAV